MLSQGLAPSLGEIEELKAVAGEYCDMSTFATFCKEVTKHITSHELCLYTTRWLPQLRFYLHNYVVRTIDVAFRWRTAVTTQGSWQNCSGAMILRALARCPCESQETSYRIVERY